MWTLLIDGYALQAQLTYLDCCLWLKTLSAQFPAAAISIVEL